jgi:sugar (pentulose or hexulose) kinase
MSQSSPTPAILALDLGTSAFKCAAVAGDRLVAEPVELPYELNRRGDEVTLDDPEKFVLFAFEALAEGARQAHNAGATVAAIGICSQAQTFIPVNAFGDPTGLAVSWLEAVAVSEVEEIRRKVRDYPTRSGFYAPSPQQFLPKVLRESRRRSLAGSQLLLLNEFIILRLTGCAFGDTTQQGMGGFFDISKREWNEEFIGLVGIRLSQLAAAMPAGKGCVPLSVEVAARLGLNPGIPVYSCGNDQSCSAIGAGLDGPGAAVCNFGTAMVVYTVGKRQPIELRENQIAGIEPLTGGFFLLGYESECGNLIDRLRRDRFADASVEEMLLSDDPGVNEVMGRLSASFGRLLEMMDLPRSARLIASGGLSRSEAWLTFLERTHGIRFERSPHEHSSLLGIARVIEANGGREG